ncbi:large-conductance mechanosensitive channel protein MscL [Flavobacterium sp. MAH-1]|uniref:Large-conductance mechanosensitive channel n=1 Tax=Flavobacterium agri TaxID=2743471 RepID=A0A7Y9C5Y2_9FLAO|nr:large-conductance mechanosensitive channel protein MscL [Flavobacterium agri]NUY81436.1 large-conductance mechanosensitive channel protein MscL [Flavobacterium agri]NYA71460.1 large-conductance mechanosensitive channel protein MscL [Flavobacterium agri]
MGMVSEFKEFIAKGNVMDLAVGVIIGAAFGKIVTSLVEDVITPALLTPALKAAQLENIEQLKTDGGILYGKFIAAVIGFVVIAFVIFLLVKGVNSMRKKEAPAPAAPAGPTNEEKLLMEIRDALKNRP